MLRPCSGSLSQLHFMGHGVCGDQQGPRKLSSVSSQLSYLSCKHTCQDLTCIVCLARLNPTSSQVPCTFPGSSMLLPGLATASRSRPEPSRAIGRPRPKEPLREETRSANCEQEPRASLQVRSLFELPHNNESYPVKMSTTCENILASHLSFQAVSKHLYQHRHGRRGADCLSLSRHLDEGVD